MKRNRGYEDKNGNQLTFAYTGGQLSTITDSQNRVTTFTYYTSGVATGELKLITDPANRTVLYSYDSNNNLYSITDPDGKVTSFGYESGSDDLTSITERPHLVDAGLRPADRECLLCVRGAQRVGRLLPKRT